MDTHQKAPSIPAPLYSQTAFDEHGNFHYQGDLHKSGELPASTATRIEAHLRVQFPDVRFAIRANGRKIIAELLDTSEDLSGRDAQDAFRTRIRDQMARFGFTRSNIYQDSHNCAFFCDVTIGRAYWSALAVRRGMGGAVDPVVSLAAFKKRLKPGDQMKLISAPGWFRTIGSVRTVKKVRSKDIVFEGPIYLDLPRAAQFACDGRLVRIAIGTEDRPDAHLLYEWTPAQAA